MRSEGYSTEFVRVCVISLTGMPLMYGYKVRYESQVNVVLYCNSTIRFERRHKSFCWLVEGWPSSVGAGCISHAE